jgi:hypothetical protein
MSICISTPFRLREPGTRPGETATQTPGAAIDLHESPAAKSSAPCCPLPTR